MNWKNIVKSIAPTIGTALGGPAAGMAIKYLSGKLLNDEEAKPEQLEEFITQASPDQLIPLKQLDNDFKLKMNQLGVDVFKLQVEDRKSARENHRDNPMPAVIVLLLTLMVAAGTYGLMVMTIPTENANIIYMVFGQVLTAWGASIAYWVGTTKSSLDKTKLIRKAHDR